jgi:16S rRNA (guanine966-N2)-methyltransferase
MRIIGGRLRGLQFAGPLTDATRPTPERAREGIASALEARGAFKGALVLDLFAGTGALSFEALSRGAHRVLLVDKDIKVLKRAVNSARTLKIQDRVTPLSLDLLQNPLYTATRIASIEEKPFSLVFADPPYRDSDRLTPLLKELATLGHLSPGCLLVIEHATGHPPKTIEQLGRVDSYRYGDTAVALLSLS